MAVGGWVSGMVFGAIKRIGPAWHDTWAEVAQDYAKVQSCTDYSLVAFMLECNDAKKRLAVPFPIRWIVNIGQDLPYCGAFSCPSFFTMPTYIYYIIIIFMLSSLVHLIDVLIRYNKTRTFKKIIKASQL